MSMTCNSCSQEITQLDVGPAQVRRHPVIGAYVDLELACPHCDQEYSAFVEVTNLEPVEDN